MRHLRARHGAHIGSRAARGAFTLAEVAVTIVIVGVTLLILLQIMNGAKLTAAHTRNQKLARELGLLTLGQVESGLLRDDIETGMAGNYAEEGYPDFNWEIAVGDDALRDTSSTDGRFDSWTPTVAEEEAKRDEDEDAEEPFEKIRVRVTAPQIREFTNELTLERWIPWTQVYGEAEGENASRNARASKGEGVPGADASGKGGSQP